MSPLLIIAHVPSPLLKSAATYSLLKQARNLLKVNGWIPVQMGYDIASDEITHTGRGMTVTYLEYRQEEENNG